MPDPTPRQRIEAERTRRGRAPFAAACARLLQGDDTDTALILVLGGPTAPWALSAGPDQRYWVRVWAARGLLWSWHDNAYPALLAALQDPAWRVREMSAKVVARHLLGDALSLVDALRADAIPRVRTAATRAVTRLTAHGA